MTKWSMNDLATYYRIGYTTIFKWQARHKDFPVHKQGNSNYFYREEIEKWLKEKFN